MEEIKEIQALPSIGDTVEIQESGSRGLVSAMAMGVITIETPSGTEISVAENRIVQGENPNTWKLIRASSKARVGEVMSQHP
jgi:hypothetical protein